MFEKIYKNTEIIEKYAIKYNFFSNEKENIFSSPKIISTNTNKITFEKIENLKTLDNISLKEIDFYTIGKILKEIHTIGKKEKYIHGDFCLQNIGFSGNEYYVIDFESPKNYEETDYYYRNENYVDMSIFIMKLLTGSPIYKVLFLLKDNFKYLDSFIKGYGEVDREKLLPYIEKEFNRFLKQIKDKSYLRFILWKIYIFFILKYLFNFHTN